MGLYMNILILCTGNSARSILGEALFNARGDGRVAAYSAGSQPKGEPHPVALEILQRHGHETARLRSKSWTEFEGPAAPVMDAVITVCDSAAAEPCPVWPGAPARAHWGLPDPAAVEAGPAQIDAFEAAYAALDARVARFLNADPDPADPRAVGAALQRAHDQ